MNTASTPKRDPRPEVGTLSTEDEPLRRRTDPPASDFRGRRRIQEIVVHRLEGGEEPKDSHTRWLVRVASMAIIGILAYLLTADRTRIDQTATVAYDLARANEKTLAVLVKAVEGIEKGIAALDTKLENDRNARRPVRQEP